jgi:hypothetical protein
MPTSYVLVALHYPHTPQSKSTPSRLLANARLRLKVLSGTLLLLPAAGWTFTLLLIAIRPSISKDSLLASPLNTKATRTFFPLSPTLSSLIMHLRHRPWPFVQLHLPLYPFSHLLLTFVVISVLRSTRL